MRLKKQLKSTILKASAVKALAFCALSPAIGQGIYALKQVNTPYDEQQPVISSQEELFLSVAFHPGNKGGSRDFGDVWFSKKNEFNQWQEAKSVPSLSTSGYDLLIGFPDDNSALVYHDGKKKPHGIHLYRRVGEMEWKYEYQLDFGSFRNNGRSFSARLHPSGDILVMSMNSYGTYGNEDIYVSFRQSARKWSVPKNIGPVVNSYEQEMTPFLSDDKQVLYFSTNGHGTQGGRDIYYTQRLDDTWEKWTEPSRLNDDINSRGVELSYFIDPNSPYTAFVTTTQNSEGYGDILMRRKEEIVLEQVKPSANDRYLAANFPGQSANAKVMALEEREASSGLIEQAIRAEEEKAMVDKVVEGKEKAVEKPSRKESADLVPNEEKKIVTEISVKPKSAEPVMKEEINEVEAPLLEGYALTLNVLDANSKEQIPFKISFSNSSGLKIGTKEGLKGPSSVSLREGTEGIVVSSNNYLPESFTLADLEDRTETIMLKPAKTGASLVLKDILFEKGTSELVDEKSLAYIRQLVDFLEENPDLKVRLEGHTDNVGNARLNKQLSMERAGVIRDHMVKQGVDFERIRLRGYGGTKPIASNDSQAGREKNRRVEMAIID